MCVRSGAVRARVRAPPAGQSEPSAAAACPPPRRAAPCSLHAAARRPPPPPPLLPPSRVLSLLSAPPFSDRSACDFCLRQLLCNSWTYAWSGSGIS
ncbi:probable E3 ubiquitin-protein ligase DTX3 isoform X2 [Balaenoptera musculus]|uniref:Probable E3 ubiquitin-protein ligase DTX3 isoform X2 n=1 Tax=Balaenoptera musculus TaxID=9771 RepID=A0A8B8X5Y2_BALMU|nr:probable E3 ubiquitin-protein ligase DTX3 isoform X2 [Balaenoptera musculus]